jgi:hypothetical protein
MRRRRRTGAWLKGGKKRPMAEELPLLLMQTSGGLLSVSQIYNIISRVERSNSRASPLSQHKEPNRRPPTFRPGPPRAHLPHLTFGSKARDWCTERVARVRFVHRLATNRWRKPLMSKESPPLGDNKLEESDLPTFALDHPANDGKVELMLVAHWISCSTCCPAISIPLVRAGYGARRGRKLQCFANALSFSLNTTVRFI